MKNHIFKTLAQYKKDLENRGYKVIYIGLYGSQNYNLDDELSDIDAKAIILPTLHDIIFRKTTSKTIENETGEIDVKDLVTYYEVVKKGNFNFIEPLQTNYFIGDKKIREMFEGIKPNLKSIYGAMLEKRKALTHEYPSKVKEFKKWGFDPKQLHHIMRLYDLLKSRTDKSYLVYENGSDELNHLIRVKRNIDNYYTKEQAEFVADNIIMNAIDLIPNDYKYEQINIDDEINEYIENKLKVELINNSKTMYARQYRTFGTPIPKTDLKKFKILEDYDGQDVSYIVYESIEIL